jgi:hypothetical protein
MRVNMPEPSGPGCKLRLAGPAGTLNITTGMTRRGPQFWLDWASGETGRSARVELMQWRGTEVGPPPDWTLALIHFRLPEGVSRRPLRLELRSAAAGQEERTFAHAQAAPRALHADIAIRWGRLRRAAAGAPIALVVLDRDGREVARDRFEPALFDDPSAALAAGRPQWEALSRAPVPPCPAGAGEVDWITVA